MVINVKVAREFLVNFLYYVLPVNKVFVRNQTEMYNIFTFSLAAQDILQDLLGDRVHGMVSFEYLYRLHYISSML